MAEYPALPLWTDAFLADTLHLSAEEVGAYLLLLFTAWRRPTCDLPDDDRFLAKVARCDLRTWKGRLRLVMAAFFKIEGGVWVQKRLQKERKYVALRSENQRRKAEIRWNKNNELSDAAAMPGQCRGNAPTPTPTPIPKKKEEDGSNARATDDLLSQLCERLGIELFDDPSRITWRTQLQRMLDDGLNFEKDIMPAAEIARANAKPSLSYIRSVAFNTLKEATKPREMHNERQRLSAHDKGTQAAIELIAEFDARDTARNAGGSRTFGDPLPALGYESTEVETSLQKFSRNLKRQDSD